MPVSVSATAAARKVDELLRQGEQQGGAVRMGRYMTEPGVLAAIRTGASATGVSFNDLAAKAAVESAFRTSVGATTSSAKGTFQFIEQTWLDMVRKHGAAHGLQSEARSIVRSGPRLTVEDAQEKARILALRNDPEVSARLAGEMMRETATQLQGVLGRPPTVAESYLGHFLGQQGASSLLGASATNPSVRAADILPAAAKANPSVFNTTEGRPLTVNELVAKVSARLQRAYADLGIDMPTGPVSIGQASSAAAVMAAAGTERLDSEMGRTAWGSETAWGQGNPAKSAAAGEQAMLAALTEVFARMRHEDEVAGVAVAVAAGQKSGRRDAATGGVALPGSVLTALRDAVDGSAS